MCSVALVAMAVFPCSVCAVHSHISDQLQAHTCKDVFDKFQVKHIESK